MGCTLKYAAIDTETTGLCPIRNQVIEVAVIIDDTDCPRSLDSLPKFSRFIYWPTLRWDTPALNMHQKSGLLADYEGNVSKLGFSEVWEELDKFLYTHFGESRIVCAGKNFAGFDRQFLKQLGDFNFHHRSLDPGSMFVKAKDTAPPDLKHCMNRVGIPNANISHRALGDAVCVVQLVRAFMKGQG